MTVIGKVDDLPAMIDLHKVDIVIIAIPSAPGQLVRMVNDVCRIKGISSRTVPGVYELIGGKVSINRLREVDINDLLRREPVRVNDEAVGATLAEKRVLVTGAVVPLGANFPADRTAESGQNLFCWVTAKIVFLKFFWNCMKTIPTC